MPYFAPFIDEAGLHIPTYNDIKEYLLGEARGIFGQDIYLEPDGQDYQDIILRSDRIHDTFLAIKKIYNNRSPQAAVGGALTSLVKLNGIKPKSATPSTAVATITVEPRTQIINGIIADDKGINWTLPTPLVVPDGVGVMTMEALATCTVLGRVTAPPNTLTNIITPTDGWLSVTNHDAAITGQEVEGQEELRARQAISTARPSRTVLEGIKGGIAEIPDVTRSEVYENDTNIFGYYGIPIPGHSICAVVEGGLDFAIANELHLRKTPGCGTYGDITIDVPSGEILPGMYMINPIDFFRPLYYDIYITITVRRLQGYSAATTDNIKESAVAYLNGLSIGNNLTISALWATALSVMPDIRRPSFSIVSVTAGIDPLNQDSVDIEIPFNALTRGAVMNVEVNYA